MMGNFTKQIYRINIIILFNFSDFPFFPISYRTTTNTQCIHLFAIIPLLLFWRKWSTISRIIVSFPSLSSASPPIDWFLIFRKTNRFSITLTLGGVDGWGGLSWFGWWKRSFNGRRISFNIDLWIVCLPLPLPPIPTILIASRSYEYMIFYFEFYLLSVLKL